MPAIVNRVEIVGNDITNESCIRDQILMLPGDVFNQERLIASYHSIANLGFFESPLPAPDYHPAGQNGDVDIVFPDDRKVAAQAAKLGKPIAEIATGKMAAPFTQLSNMVLSHASEEGVTVDSKAAGGKSLVDNLKSMLAKPKDKAA